jgi:protein involved in polysaccharide export with SLBB domain
MSSLLTIMGAAWPQAQNNGNVRPDGLNIPTPPPASATQSPTIVNPGPPSNGVQTITNIPQDRPQAPPSEVKSRAQEPRTEFEEYASRVFGRELRLYGRELFLEPPSTFAPVDRVPVPADYVIGPGDEILVRAWGQIDVDFRTVVDRDGKIYIPKVGAINVAGIQYQNLDRQVRTAVARIFKNFELNVSLGQLRSIQVYVVGQARKPGGYVIGSLSTLVNAIFASGGPSSKGSMRRIQLKRGSKVITEFDLYDLLLRGDMSKDVKLLPGDVIFIPSVGALAAVSGSVNAPAIYEIKSDTLGDILQLAGGLATTASGQRVTLERVVNRESRTVEEFPLDTVGLKRELRDGDLLNVHTLSPKVANSVTLRGNVAEPMRFAWKEGMKVSNIIPEKEALIVPGYWVERNLVGRADSWLREQPDRELTAAQSESLLRTPGDRDREASTLFIRSGDDVNWDYAVVERLDREALRTTLIPFNLAKAVLDKDVSHDLLLMPNDVVTIFSKKDIRVPRSSRSHFITLEGEFMAAGVYEIKQGETLRQLVMRVGGVTQNAYLFGAEFTRESAREDQQRQLDAALARLEAEAERVALERAQNIITKEDADALTQQAIAQRGLIQRLKQIRATGRIVLGLPVKNPNIKHLPDMPLEDGDRFFIPPVPGTVNVFGAVYNQNAYVFKDRSKTGDYLKQAGGPTKDADKGSIYIVRADGSVLSNRQKGWFGSVDNERVNPGDSVVVPESFAKFSFTRELKDWSQIFFQFALGVAAIDVLKDEF